MEHTTSQKNTASGASLYWAAGLSLYAVIFLWNFWDVGPLVLGFNASVFVLGLLFACRRLLPKGKLFSKQNLVWVIPFLCIVASYTLYENPFIKMVNIPAIPVLAIVFLTYAHHARIKTFLWSTAFISHLVERAGYMLGAIPAAITQCVGAITPSKGFEKSNSKRIGVGIVLLVVIALTIVLPLLGSANPEFSILTNRFYAWLGDIVGPELFGRVIMFIVFAFGILAMLLSWRRAVKDAKEHSDTHAVDSIISGIVLGGILLIYILFLVFELGHLWVSSLPFDFKETEQLVKSGFWQLLALTILNIIFFFGCYRQTNKIVQRLLIAFTGASFLLLASAGWRMGMYVFFYGLSYEKFYAAYTVIFCAILLVWLFSRLFVKRNADLIKGAAFLLLWMYAIVTVFPTEQIIFAANTALAARADSRIELYELTMLSPSVLGAMQAAKNINPNAFAGWEEWEENAKKIVDDKSWYEMNLENIVCLTGC